MQDATDAANEAAAIEAEDMAERLRMFEDSVLPPNSTIQPATGGDRVRRYINYLNHLSR